MAWLNLSAFILTVVGGINWGLVGLFDFNLVTFLFGALPFLVSIIYILVGISVFYTLYAYYTRP